VRAPSDSWTPALAPDLGKVVARVGEVPVFAAEVDAEARRTGQSAREALADLVAFNLLAERARAAGLRPEDPGGLQARREVLVQRLIERDFEPRLEPEALTDAELRPMYERLKSRYVHPRLVEVVIASVYTGPRMKPEPRTRARATATEFRDFVAKRPLRTAEDLLTAAREPSWVARNVAVAQLLQGPDKPFGPEVGAAVLNLVHVGDTTSLVEDENGYHLARYVGERPPRNVPYEEAREALRAEVLPAWRQQRFLQVAASLAPGHSIELYPARLTEPAGAP
jgi:hypothetical protein